jgi:lipoyl(octanoyl) transferase
MPLLKLDQVVIKDLGIKQYQETFSAMKDFVAKGEDESIWMLEHYPVFTLGTAADQKHILKRTDIDIFQADRGGEVTYHGPGQLVIYFLLNIKKRNLGPKKFVKQLEDLVQKTLLDFQIQSNTIEGSPGVYVDSKKIASIGLRFSKGFSYHGISINVDMDLDPFKNINPCGYEGLQVTQIKDIYSNITLEKVKSAVEANIQQIF